MKQICSITIAFMLCGSVIAQTPAKERIPLKYGAQYTGKRTDSAMAKWRYNRFGQFLHWGLYSIPGGVWNGKTYAYAAEFLKSSAHIPSSTWDSLMYQFNPVKFDAKAWAKMDKTMGVKYITISTKHHEGFCMWPSKYTDFSIANSPFKRDLLKEIVDAYTAEGIDVNLYYSVLDWHNPDWRYDIKNTSDSIAFARYLEFAKNQLAELAQRYPQVKGFWFDGTWDESVKKNGKWTLDVELMLKQLIPGVIVNSRLRADDYGKRHRDSNGDIMGDYESGYERKLPSPYDTLVTKTDWEACMTIPENQWGYHKDWSLSHVKSSNEILENIIRAVALSGNMLVNFGPKADGTFREEELVRAKEIGEWMKVNSDAVYGGGYAGLERQDWGYYTKSSVTGKVYMVVFNVPINYSLLLKLPANTKIESAAMLGSREQYTPEEIAANQYFIHLKEKGYNKPFVIELTLKQEKKSDNKYKAPKT